MNQSAPDFNVKDVFDNSYSLQDYKGKKLLISFYRYASCPLCNLRVSELMYYQDEWGEHGMEMLAFFESPRESIEKYVGQQNTPFPIIPDPERDVYKAYGVETSLFGWIKGGMKLSLFKEAAQRGFKGGRMEGDRTLIPADFIIDEDSNIVAVYYGSDISDHMPIDMIENVLGIE